MSTFCIHVKVKSFKKKAQTFLLCHALLCLMSAAAASVMFSYNKCPKSLSPLLIKEENIFQKLSDFPLGISGSHASVLTERGVGNGVSGIFCLYCEKRSLWARKRDGGMWHRYSAISVAEDY